MNDKYTLNKKRVMDSALECDKMIIYKYHFLERLNQVENHDILVRNPALKGTSRYAISDFDIKQLKKGLFQYDQ